MFELKPAPKDVENYHYFIQTYAQWGREMNEEEERKMKEKEGETTIKFDRTQI